MLKYMLLWCFTPALDIYSQQQLPLYNTHFASLPQMLLKRGNTVLLFSWQPGHNFTLTGKSWNLLQHCPMLEFLMLQTRS